MTVYVVRSVSPSGDVWMRREFKSISLALLHWRGMVDKGWKVEEPVAVTVEEPEAACV